MRITPDLLRSATGCTQERAVVFADALDQGCAEYEITTPQRLAHFLAQVGHESGALAHVLEVWGPTPAQQRYEGRIDLGNTQPGDGERYCGRGLLQTTGRSNYRSLRDRLRARGMDAPDFEAAPQLLEQPKWAVLSACDYWGMRRINHLADANDFEGVTRAVNGGTNGIDDRRRRFERAKAVLLGIEQEPDDRPAPAAPTPKEAPVVAPVIAVAGGFLWELAKTAIKAFAPLAQEKLTKEISRHTGKPEIAEQVATAIIQTAQVATGIADPVEAVVAAKANPAIVQQMESSALETIDKLMPVLEKMQAWDQAAWAAEEASRTAADERARFAEKDQDEFLTRAIVGLVIGLMVSLILLIGTLMYLKADSGTVGTLVGLFAAAGGAIVGAMNTRIQHRYGSSRGSAAKDAINAELARWPRSPT